MRRAAGFILLIFAILMGGFYLISAKDKNTQQQRELASSAGVTVADVLSGSDSQGFARALHARNFIFPVDHGAHPDYKHEWWYFTGNLKTAQGRHFGYQLTFFRIGLKSQPVARNSAWATHEVYMAHFTLTDVASGKFYYFERFSRSALELAGVSAEPFKLWLEDWMATGSGENLLPLHLQAAQDDVAIELTLESRKPVVLQGDNGLSQKSSEPGNASYYYSLTRLASTGNIHIGAQRFVVEGLSWMDREWSSSPLSKDQSGWDWFSLQLNDGRELMFYRLRRKDAKADSFSAGTLIGVDGSVQPLRASDVQIETLEHWKSPHTGARYPSRWRLKVPGQKLDLQITPYIDDQELNVSVRYWEGAVRAEGRAHGKPVSGNGYVEMTGYSRQGLANPP